MIQLILAKETDLGIISNMAREIWNVHYVGMIGQEQVDYMLGKFYNHQSLVEQMHKGQRFYLVQRDGRPIGFLAVSSVNDSDYFLHKLYIYSDQSNAGLGTETLDRLIELVNPKSLSLTVNRQNFKSINFYFKNGFKITSVENFDIGSGYEMNDFVMVRQFRV